MNGFDFMSVYLLITFLVSWIDGLSNELPPERCRLFFLNATASYHEDNKQPTIENLKQIIPILVVPYNLSSSPNFRCNETTVTLQNVTFSSSRVLNATRLDLVFKIEPKKNVRKIWAYLCAENMLDQGSCRFREVERFLRLRNDDLSAPFYQIDQKACCEDQYLYYEPCCRKGYTLRNLTCVKDLERKNDTQKGDVLKMERETGENCEPSGPTLSVGVIIIIICVTLILFVSIILAGVRIWKHKHRPNRSGYDDVPDAITTEGHSEERRDNGESSGQNVAVPGEEETKDGYMKMHNLSQTNLMDRNTRPTSITTTNNNNHNTLTTTINNNENGQNSPVSSKFQNRPISRAEMLFDFNKHIPIEAINFTNKMLGRGQFGQVELAYATINGIRNKCAVKMIRGRGTEEDERELFEELQMLYQIPYHPNVVSLLGGCMDENSPLYVVVEYCANGSLLKHLHKNRNSSDVYVNISAPMLDFRWKIRRAIEICTGMIFLAQRQIIHRDLAARNILLDENEVAKISDFGMAKDVYLRGLYIKETAGFLPVRWMAIEAIESSMYTIKSDMWSFGILLWELYMDGLNPYPGVIEGSELLEKYLKRGFRMAHPENCPDSFYQLMERCWLTKPEDRPQFTQALRELEIIKEDEMRRESEASKVTEISDADDVPVFDDEEQETNELTQTPQKETQASQEDEQTPQKEDAEVNMTESENPIEIGIVNRGRNSIDSGANVELPRTLRKNSVEQTSYC